MSRPRLVIKCSKELGVLLTQMAAEEHVTVETIILAAIYSVVGGWLQNKLPPKT